MGPCNNRCRDLPGATRAPQYIYAGGRRFCRTCRTGYFGQEHRCPCCGSRTSLAPKFGPGKKRRQEAGRIA